MHACVCMSAKSGLMVMRLSHLVEAGHLISCIGLKLTAERLNMIPSPFAHCLAEAYVLLRILHTLEAACTPLLCMPR